MITVVLGRSVQFLLMLAMMRVATTLLPPEEMGKISIVTATIAFFSLFLVNPVGTFINRRLHAWRDNGSARHYFICYSGYILLISILAAIILLLIQNCELVRFGMPIAWLLMLVSGSLVFNTMNQTAIPALNLLGDSMQFILLTIFTTAFGFVFALLFVQIGQPVAQYWLLGLLFGQAVLGIIGTRVLFLRLVNREALQPIPMIHKHHLQSLISFAWPVALAASMNWVQVQAYRYIVEGQLGLYQLGIFAAGYSLSAGLIAGFESVLTTYFQPRLYRDANTRQKDLRACAWLQYAEAIIPSLVLTVGLIVILAPELTRLFLGSNFQSAANVVVWGALAEAARVASGVYSLIAHVHMRTHWLILPGFVGATLSLALCASLMPFWGITGVGVGLVVAGLAVVVTMHAMLAREVHGGIAIRPVLLAGFSVGGLWVGALAARQFWATGGWGTLGGTLFLVGSMYLGVQYLFLMRHLLAKRVL